MAEGAPEKESVSISIEELKSSFMNMPSEKKEEEKPKKSLRKPFKLEKSEKKPKEEKVKKETAEKPKQKPKSKANNGIIDSIDWSLMDQIINGE